MVQVNKVDAGFTTQGAAEAGLQSDAPSLTNNVTTATVTPALPPPPLLLTAAPSSGPTRLPNTMGGAGVSLAGGAAVAAVAQVADRSAVEREAMVRKLAAYFAQLEKHRDPNGLYLPVRSKEVGGVMQPEFQDEGDALTWNALLLSSMIQINAWYHSTEGSEAYHHHTQELSPADRAAGLSDVVPSLDLSDKIEKLWGVMRDQMFVWSSTTDADGKPIRMARPIRYPSDEFRTGQTKSGSISKDGVGSLTLLAAVAYDTYTSMPPAQRGPAALVVRELPDVLEGVTNHMLNHRLQLGAGKTPFSNSFISNPAPLDDVLELYGFVPPRDPLWAGLSLMNNVFSFKTMPGNFRGMYETHYKMDEAKQKGHDPQGELQNAVYDATSPLAAYHSYAGAHVAYVAAKYSGSLPGVTQHDLRRTDRLLAEEDDRVHDANLLFDAFEAYVSGGDMSAVVHQLNQFPDTLPNEAKPALDDRGCATYQWQRNRFESCSKAGKDDQVEYIGLDFIHVAALVLDQERQRAQSTAAAAGSSLGSGQKRG